MKKFFKLINLLLVTAIVLGTLLTASFTVNAASQIYYNGLGYQAGGTAGTYNDGIDKVAPVNVSGHVIYGCNTNLAPGTYKLAFVISLDKSTVAAGNESSTLARFNPVVNGRELFPRDFSSRAFALSNTYETVPANITVLNSDLPPGSTTAPLEVRLWSNGIGTLRIRKIIISDVEVDLSVYANSNIASAATVTASSEYSQDYSKNKAVDGLTGASYEWASLNQQNPWIQLNWASSQSINTIVISDRINTADNANGGTLSFSDGSSVTVTGLSANGQGKIIEFSTKTGISWVKFQVSGGSGSNVGLGEFEVYYSSLQSLPAPVAEKSYGTWCGAQSGGTNGTSNEGSVRLVPSGVSGYAVWNCFTDLTPGTYKLTFIMAADQSSVAASQVNSRLIRFNPVVNGRQLFPRDDVTANTFFKSNSWQEISAKFTVLTSDIPGGSSTANCEMRLWSEGIGTFRVKKIIVSDFNYNTPTFTSDNLSDSASVTASSEYNTSYGKNLLKDGITMINGSGEWASLGEQNPWAQYNWSSPVKMNTIVLYDRLNSSDNANGGTLSFSDNSSVTVTGIPIDGNPLIVSFPEKSNISWVRFQVSGGSGPNVGLAEMEAYYFIDEINVAPKATYQASTIYALPNEGMSSAEIIMISSLQGLLAKKSDKQILLYGDTASTAYLNDMATNYGVEVKYVNDPWYLLKLFKNYSSGYILYHYNGDGTDSSINVATSMAGPWNALLVDDTIESTVNAYGVTNKLLDARGKDESWVFSNYWNLFRHDIVCEQKETYTNQLRDFAIMGNIFTFWSGGVSTFRTQVLSALEDNGKVIGWSDSTSGEFGFIDDATRKGVYTIPSDWSSNLSTYSGFKSIPLKQNRTTVPQETNVHYVTIVLSDGDNQQFMAGGFGTDTNYYGSPLRGNFNMGWPIPPAMYNDAPTILKWLYNNATSRDQFIAGPSGTGYMYPSRFPINELDKHVQMLNSVMEQTDTRVACIIDEKSFYNTALWDKYTSQPNIDGLFYLDYSRHDNYKGNIVWSNGKPVISCTDLLWSGLEEESTAISNINSRSRDIHSPNAYTMLYVHAWSKNMSNINTVVQGLNSDVRIVSPEQFVNLIRKNIGDYSTGLVYQAEQESISTGVGASGTYGWECQTGRDNAGYMINSSNYSTFPQGPSSAIFNLRIDSISNPETFVAQIQAYDSTTGKLLASKDLKAKNFGEANVFKPFKIDFTNPGSDNIQFRIWWYGKVNTVFKNVEIQSLKIYEAEGTSLFHSIGASASDGWYASVSAHNAGHMIYGPYVTNIPAGANKVTYSMQIDNNTSNDYQVVNLDVFDATSGVTIASKAVTRKQFITTNAYQDFTVDFININPGHSLEFRIWWYDRAYIKVDKITVCSSKTFAAPSWTLSHINGRSTADGWSASVSLDNPGHMIFGPYTQCVPGGTNRAIFRAKVDNRSGNDDNIIICEVYDSTTGTTLASNTISRLDFTASNTYQDFTSTFNNTAGHTLEFRVWYCDTATVTVDCITIKQ